MVRDRQGFCYVLSVNCLYLPAAWACQHIVGSAPLPPTATSLGLVRHSGRCLHNTVAAPRRHLTQQDGCGTDGRARQHSERAPQPPRPLPTAATLVAPVCDLRSPAPPRAAPEVCDQSVVLCSSIRLFRRPEHRASCLQPLRCMPGQVQQGASAATLHQLHYSRKAGSPC
jgi:hypothetical protein